jgi:predicted phosphohydrolase
MSIFAISDLHLGFSAEKPMDIFGVHWKNHAGRIEEEWAKTVGKDDLVLIPGDISWAMKIEQAHEDFDYIDKLPGHKIIIKGNHDYWWLSLRKLKMILPASITPIQNTAYTYGDIGIAGTRLWVDPYLNIETIDKDDQKIFDRELGRLDLSLKALPTGIDKIIVMTHFPPISFQGRPGRALEIVKNYNVHTWIFGHMHLDGNDYSGFNTTIGTTRFIFVSSDFIGFKPVRII